MRKNLLVVFVALAALAMGQSSDSGISFRGTFSGSVAATDRLQIQTPDASRITAGYRALLNPSIKLGQHWFGYASLQVLGKPYFFYDTYRSPRAYSTEVLQAFGGYQFRADRATVVIKAGQLTSAFGSFPLHYDDLENPVMSQPLSYLQRLTMRLDQLPCGTADLVSQPYGAVKLKCGGTVGGARGMGVATLYALPGVEADVSFGRWDARVQMAGGSPSNADGFRYLGVDRLQWVAGGGYSIHQGFRVGGSAFRGPYLGGSAPAYLPAGKTIRDYPNTGMGLDIQWARGRLSASGEMQRFVFSSPNFVQSPNWLFAYGETKIIVTPRLFIAGRSGNLHAGAVRDVTGISSAQFAPGIVSTEAAVGLWLGPRVLLKTGYEWLRREDTVGGLRDVYGAQLIFGLPTLALPFKR